MCAHMFMCVCACMYMYVRACACMCMRDVVPAVLPQRVAVLL